MKMRIKHFFLYGLVYLSPCVFLTAKSASAATPEVACVFVEQARIAQRSLSEEGKFRRANFGHQITRGDHTVLALRVYEDEGAGPDSQSFKKATLEIAAVPETLALEQEISIGVHRSSYAQGASGWIVDGGYQWAASPFPQIKIRRDANGLHVVLKSRIRTMNESPFSRVRGEKWLDVDMQCPVRQVTVMQLTPWLGSVGTSWASFYGHR